MGDKNRADADEEIEIDVFKTPEGNVPTVKGLETAVNKVYDDIVPIAQSLLNLDKKMANVANNLKEISNTITGLSDTLADFIVIISRLNLNIERMISQDSSKDLANYRKDLVAVQKVLSTLLVEIGKKSAELTEPEPNA